MKSVFLSLAFFFVAAASAADTKLQQPWVDHDYVGSNNPIKSILVIGVPDHPDERRKLEDSFTRSLAKAGVNATASLDIMAADTEVSKESVLAALEGRDIEAVLLTRVFRIEDIEIVQGGDPGTMRTDRDFAIQLWANYEDARDQVLNAPRSKKQRLVLENNLYDLDSENLIWTVQSYSMNIKSADKVIKSLTPLVTDSLKKQNLI